LSDLAVAALLAGTILAASMISVEVGFSVALIELAAGFIVGNAFSLGIPGWLSFIGSFAGVVLTFLAGAEVDVPQFRREWRASVAIGLVSFSAPFVVVGLLAYYGLGWNHRQAEIAGIALSTTSLAVVYAVLVESGLNQAVIGKRIMSATFVTDLGTVTALTVLFIKPTIWILPFVVVSVALILGLPRVAVPFFARYGNRVIEPEIKLVFASLFLLMWLGTRANSQAVLPAFILGLVMSDHYVQHRTEQQRMRVVAFAFLTPFFFLKGGMNVSASALWGNLGILALLFLWKMLPKLAGVYPLARRYCSPHATFTTLLMSTGLTFGTISSLYGLNAGIIDRTQFSLLVAVVVLSAIVPTAIAQRFFQPHAERELAIGQAGIAPMPPAAVGRASGGAEVS
jgi:Kef-type K+ transport system membrane component KefB